MADKRKLMGEIDRTLKKVDEGIIVFDDLMEKVQGARDPSHKEKHESDLKKEIKKLQRLRDTIKGWIAGYEVKDKTILIETRRKIETKMEAFKVCEKEAKTKQFSKEGLSREAKLDPQEVAKNKTRNFLQESIQTLNDQSEMLDADVEKLSQGKKASKNKGEIAKLSSKIEVFNSYSAKMEQIIRLMDNDILTSDQVDSHEDAFSIFLEQVNNGDDVDEEELDYVFEDLGLDDAPINVVDVSSTKKNEFLDEEEEQQEDNTVEEKEKKSEKSSLSAKDKDSKDRDSHRNDKEKEDNTKRSSSSKRENTSLSSTHDNDNKSNDRSSKTESRRSSFPGSGIAPPISSTPITPGTSTSFASIAASNTKQNQSSNSITGDSNNKTVPQSPLVTSVGNGRVNGNNLINTPTPKPPNFSSIAKLANASTTPNINSTKSGNIESGKVLLKMENGKMVSDPNQINSNNRGIVSQISLNNTNSTLAPGPTSTGNDNNNINPNTTPNMNFASVANPNINTSTPGTSSSQINQQQKQSLTNQNQMGSSKDIPGSGRSGISDGTTVPSTNATPTSIQSGAGGARIGTGSGKVSSLEEALKAQNSNSGNSQATQGLTVELVNNIYQQQEQQYHQQVQQIQASSLTDNQKQMTIEQLKTRFQQQIQQLMAQLHQQYTSQNQTTPQTPSGQQTGGNRQLLHPQQSPNLHGSQSQLLQQQQQLQLQQQQLLYAQQQAQQKLRLEYDNVFNALARSMAYIPNEFDSERPKIYTPRLPYPDLQKHEQNGFPDQPKSDPNSIEALFTKYEEDTLFFIFYHQQGTYQQYLAARELRKKKWFYHKNIKKWFKHVREPTQIEEGYENGSYYIFNPEGEWSVRQQDDFKLEYAQVEKE